MLQDTEAAIVHRASPLPDWEEGRRCDVNFVLLVVASFTAGEIFWIDNGLVTPTHPSYDIKAQFVIHSPIQPLFAV